VIGGRRWNAVEFLTGLLQLGNLQCSESWLSSAAKDNGISQQAR
jgi:hypothetical protein